MPFVRAAIGGESEVVWDEIVFEAGGMGEVVVVGLGCTTTGVVSWWWGAGCGEVVVVNLGCTTTEARVLVMVTRWWWWVWGVEPRELVAGVVSTHELQ